MNIISERTLKDALAYAKLSSLPTEWDGKTIFKRCLVKIGAMYVYAEVDLKDPFKYKVKKTFIMGGYTRSDKDIIYPIIEENEPIKKTKGATKASVKSVPTIQFENITEARKWLQKKGYKAAYIIKDTQVPAKVQEVLIEEQMNIHKQAAKAKKD